MKEANYHNEKMKAYCNAVCRLEDKFDGLKLNHITRKYHEEANELANITSGRTTIPPNVFIRDLTKPSVDFKNPTEATGVAPKHSGAAIVETSAKDPSTEEPETMDTDIETSSVDEAEGKELIRDIHASICGHHAAPRTLVGNAFRQGFYWPTAVADSTDVVRTCEGCQFYAWKTHLTAHALQTIPITWPFIVWGLDLVGPL
ncbi:uncharacterized protein LOC120689003 [Panicum virgatum]|uniref:uncharacterized protein LOC120689003 n=1 Tax=Panicum virgatum TaxID=38727 RepID=UPI0019D5260D|nr:uncharacterized protein LOC120689003 [Panicum virgatum]